MKKLSRMTLLGATALIASLVLSSCGSDSDEESQSQPTAEETNEGAEAEDADDAQDEAKEEADETDEDSETDGDYQVPDWGYPIEESGEKMGTIENDTVRIDVWEVDRGKSTKDSMMADPDSNEPLIQEGDQVLIYQYIMTNTSDETIPLSTSLMQMSEEYAGSKFIHGATAISDSSWLDELGLHDIGVAEMDDNGIYLLEPDESVAHASIFEFQEDELTIKADVTPVDDDGDLDHDNAIMERETVTIDVK